MGSSALPVPISAPSRGPAQRQLPSSTFILIESWRKSDKSLLLSLSVDTETEVHKGKGYTENPGNKLNKLRASPGLRVRSPPCVTHLHCKFLSGRHCPLGASVWLILKWWQSFELPPLCMWLLHLPSRGGACFQASESGLALSFALTNRMQQCASSEMKGPCTLWFPSLESCPASMCKSSSETLRGWGTI